MWALSELTWGHTPISRTGPAVQTQGHLNRHLNNATVEAGVGGLSFFPCAPLAFSYLTSQGGRFSTDYAIDYAVCKIQ